MLLVLPLLLEHSPSEHALIGCCSGVHVTMPRTRSGGGYAEKLRGVRLSMSSTGKDGIGLGLSMKKIGMQDTLWPSRFPFATARLQA